MNKFRIYIILIVCILGIGSQAYAGNVQEHLRCLALNIYYEARNQSLEGQLAVGYVTINRVKHKRFPNNVCDVVKQYKQFSWFWDKLPDTPREKLAWEDAKRHALYVLSHPHDNVTHGATHYHTHHVKPYWASKMTIVTVIGDHIFYKRKNEC